MIFHAPFPGSAGRSLRMLALAALLPLAIAGCSITETLNEKSRIDYKSAGKSPPLELPPDLGTLRGDERYAMPDRGSRDRTYSTYSSGQAAERPAATATKLLPSVEGARVERAGTQRWLVVNQPADKLWPVVREFWQESGFLIQNEVPQAGIMETDWAENRAKIPQDFIRNTVGRVFDSLYSTGERDKFRTRLEPRGDGGTEVYISHRGMVETFTNAQRDSTVWQPRASDPELEAEFLRRLMVKLGTSQEQAGSAVAAAAPAAPERARVQTANGQSFVELSEGFDRAWRRVGLALDRGGFTVEDRDRSQGMYFVRYIDPEVDNASATKPGFFARLFSRTPSDSGSPRYRVKLDGGADATKVMVLDKDGKPVGSDIDRKTADRILALLQEQLKQ